MAELNWTDAQWQNVNAAVAKTFREASVANAFLPMYGPVAGSAEIVRNERLVENAPQTISLDADHDAVNLKLVNLTVKVELSSEQVVDETLSNALLTFRRAANILALQQDLMVFSGYHRGFAREDSEFVANQVGPQKGLADLPARYAADSPEKNAIFPIIARSPSTARIGQAVVLRVVAAIGSLEATSNPGPFACVLGDDLFNSVHTPSQSLVLPADRITPQLKGGPLLRSGMMRRDTGVVVSLAANAVDIVVGTPPVAQFLQRQPNARYLFRVYERFVLRIRDAVTLPVDVFRIKADPQTRSEESARLEALAVEAAAKPDGKVLIARASAQLDHLNT